MTLGRTFYRSQLVLLQCSESGSDFLAGFVNIVLAGCCPTTILPLFFGGRLIALAKKSGGIRLRAVGMSLHQLVSKCASLFGTSRLATYFSPQQRGIAIPCGCEAAVHGQVVKLDFNAFNSLHRSDMLQAAPIYPTYGST